MNDADEPLSKARLDGRLKECHECGQSVGLCRHIVVIDGRHYARCYDCPCTYSPPDRSNLSEFGGHRPDG